MKKIILFLLFVLLPIGVFADAPIDADSMVTQMKAVIDQYGVRIKALEAENTILRNVIMKAGITIPLTAFS